LAWPLTRMIAAPNATAHLASFVHESVNLNIVVPPNVL
jgi:hypothetical protein